MNKDNNFDAIIAIVATLIIFTIFLISYSNQSQIEISKFESCINTTNCLTILINLTQDISLCNKAQNISTCYQNQAFKQKNSKLCFYTTHPLSCIISLSVQENKSFCNEFSNIQFEECEFNVNYYLNITN